MGIINNLINSIKDNFTMAEFSINGRMTVKSLRKQFKDAFGASLRVYKGAKFFFSMLYPLAMSKSCKVSQK